MDYIQLLDDKYREALSDWKAVNYIKPNTAIEGIKLEFLAEELFGVYMGGHDFTAEVGRWAVELALALNSPLSSPRTLMQRSEADCRQVLLLLNLEWFQQRTDWGVSIAQSFWSSNEDSKFVVFDDVEMNRNEFEEFIAAVGVWSGVVEKPNSETIASMKKARPNKTTPVKWEDL